MLRKLAVVLLLLSAIEANAQIGWEEFYSENDLRSNVQHARTANALLDATGSLAVYYHKIVNDSLGKIYLQKVFKIAENANDVSLMAKALWWDVYSEGSIANNPGSIEKSNKLLHYADQHNLVKWKISANLSIVDINIHKDLSRAEEYALAAQNLWDNWKKDTLDKDSMKLEIYSRFVHTYIHKKDGVKTARYLQMLQDYARQNQNESLKIQATEVLETMYFEWDGQEKKAIPWLDQEHEYFRKTKQFNKLFATTSSLAMLYSKLQNKEKAKIYFNEAEKLQDSLHAYGYFQFYWLWYKYDLKLISLSQFVQVLDNHFNNHFYLPPAMTADTKAQLYLGINQLDSAWLYISLAGRLGDNKELLSKYYWKTKDYDKLIPLLTDFLKTAEKQGDIGALLWQSLSLSRAFELKKQYKKAYEYLDKAYTLKDSLHKLTNEKAVAEMEMQKQQEIQETESSEQKRLQQTETARIAFRNKVRLYGLGAGLLILLVIAGILWRNNQRKQKDKLKIEQAYNDLESTQAQLIQSEKMASLGELTAGIAHEIQNPLNFVNNFSEVNTELIDELEQEVNKGNLDEIKSIVKDIKENEEKINHHGKRADSIVKGMLQHSRASSGQKELTDINALADEYLRLAYHGMRAKEKTLAAGQAGFNVAFKTDFDNSIGKIKIIPQDIGRVLLNLINNAFYFVNESASAKATADSSYQPTVTVITKKIGDKVEIIVADNGNGIPKKILDKVFQPFFTTKPSGQGTGLGLSLSYDIIKAHGGDLKVKTKEQEGTEFIILLPIA